MDYRAATYDDHRERRPAADPDGTERFAVFAQQIIVGINRNARGEHLSASARVRGQALELLASLVARPRPAANPMRALDNLDPQRRFEHRRVRRHWAG